MMNLTALKGVAHAESYYDHDDYYRESGQAPSQWLGAAAPVLGLRGEASRDELREVLGGELPDGSRLGTERDGKWQHRAGWDATFSAPKSVSVAALVGGDDRLVAAHDEAVRVAFQWLEKNAAQTRIREGGQVRVERTGNLGAAAFRHATSRDQDPQLHSHCLIANMTRDAGGRWRSVDSQELYRVQHDVNEVYSQALARRARELGYTVEQSKSAWELAEVRAEIREAYSSRRAAVDAWLRAHGHSRETASAELRERATLATRARKEHGVDRVALAQKWRERGESLGFDARAQVRAVQAREVDVGALRSEARAAAEQALESAAAQLAERQSRFSRTELERAATRAARATAAAACDVNAAIDEAAERGALLRRAVENERGAERGYTTPDAVRTERAMLASERAGRGAVEPLQSVAAALNTVQRAEQKSEHPWTAGQREASAGILAGDARVQGVQGFAGTAKTTTVLKTVAAQAEAAGYVVRGMAPTQSAAEQLSEGASVAESRTVASHLAQERRRAGEQRGAQGQRRELWLVDEASMLSAKDTRDLLRASERAGARVVMVGDVQQLGSVEAGEAFRQLQNGGMQTHILDDIVRQQNTDAREAVEASIRGDAGAAMQAIERSGHVNEIREAGARREQIARDYLSMSKDDRAAALVIDPTRAGRRQLNEEIRSGLRSEGSLTGADVAAEHLERKDLTESEAKDASRYERGDFVTFTKSYKSVGIEAGKYYSVESIDYAAKAVQLKGDNGKTVGWQPALRGGKNCQIFQSENVRLAAGDQLQWSKNDRERGLANGDRLTVERVTDKTMLARDARGRAHEINTQERSGQHWRHAYATTVHASQGRTAGRVLANLGGEAKKLLDQRSYYTAISRAKDTISLYTDNRAQLETLISARSGVRQTALENIREREAERGAEKERERQAQAEAARAAAAQRSRGRERVRERDFSM